MIDPELRKKGLKLLKETPASPEDVRKLLQFLEEFLKQSPDWTNEDNLLEARGILSSISILIGRTAKALNMDLGNERAPPVRAWFNYGGNRVYLNDRQDPLDLKTFREALGNTVAAERRIQHIGGTGGERGAIVAASSDARGKEKEVEREVIPAEKAGGGDTSRPKEVEILEESESDGSEYQEEAPTSREAPRLGDALQKANTVPKAPKKGKKRKSPATVPTSGEEDAHQDSEPLNRPKETTDEAALGRYDPPCDRCRAENRTDCFYTRFNNACQRCKPSKLKCSYAKGSRKKLKTAEDPTKTAVPPGNAQMHTTKANPSTAHVPLDRKRPAIAPKERSPLDDELKPRKSEPKEKTIPPKNKRATSAEERGEQGSSDNAKKHAGANQKTITTPGSPAPMTIYGLDGRKLGQVPVREGPPEPHLIEPQTVDPSTHDELANETRQALAHVRERQYAFEHRLADVEARTSTTIRELRWYQSDRENIKKLVCVTDSHDDDIVNFGKKHDATIDHVSKLGDEVKDTKSSMLKRIESVESRGGVSLRFEEVQGNLRKADKELGEKFRTMQEAQRVRDQNIQDRMRLVEERLSKAEASADGAKKISEDLATGQETFGERLSKAESEVGGAGVLAAIAEVKALVEGGKAQAPEMEERLGRIETMVAGILGAVEKVKANHDNGIDHSAGTMASNMQAQFADIIRLLDHAVTDLRHVKSALDLHGMALDNVLRTIQCGVREEGLSTRRDIQTQLSVFRQDINTQLDTFRKVALAQLVWNGLRSGAGALGTAAGVGQYPANNGMGGDLQQRGGVGEQGGYAPFIWGATTSGQNAMSLNGSEGHQINSDNTPQEGVVDPSLMGMLDYGVLPPVPGGLLENLHAPLQDHELPYGVIPAPPTASVSDGPQSISGHVRPSRSAGTSLRDTHEEDRDKDKGKGKGVDFGEEVKGEGGRAEEEEEEEWEDMPASPNQSTAVNIDRVSTRGSIVSRGGPSTFSQYSHSVPRGPRTANSSPLSSPPLTPARPASTTSNPDNL